MKHISYSELKIWNDCPYKHKLIYIDKIKEFLGNEYTAFGKAIHDTCERILLSTEEVADLNVHFETRFLDELKKLEKNDVELRKDLIMNMRKQGNSLVEFILTEVKNYFNDYKVVSVEEKLYEDIEDHDYKFKGYIDLVLKTSDGKYHVIDWKTCSWGWNSKKKSDRMITYQLTLYKSFYAKKHNINPENIETYFALLKRTAKKDRVEIFRVTSGAKKTENALNLMNKSIYNILNNRYYKNRLSCTANYGCEFYKTQYCE